MRYPNHITVVTMIFLIILNYFVAVPIFVVPFELEFRILKIRLLAKVALDPSPSLRLLNSVHRKRSQGFFT